MLTDDVKIQTLLAQLEELCEGDDDECYILRLENKKGDSVYSGGIAVHMLPVDGDFGNYIMNIGTIPDERHARKLVACANAVPQLLAYITQLEAKVK